MHPVARGMGVEMRGWDVVFINCPIRLLWLPGGWGCFAAAPLQRPRQCTRR